MTSRCRGGTPSIVVKRLSGLPRFSRKATVSVSPFGVIPPLVRFVLGSWRRFGDTSDVVRPAPCRPGRAMIDGLVMVLAGAAVFGAALSNRGLRRRLAAQAAADGTGARLPAAIEDMAEGFVICDRDGRLVVCNGRCREFWGYSEEDAAPGVTFEALASLDRERCTIVDPSQEYAYRRCHVNRHLASLWAPTPEIMQRSSLAATVSSRRRGIGGVFGGRPDGVGR